MSRSIEHPVCDCQYCLKRRRDHIALAIYASFATSERRADIDHVDADGIQSGGCAKFYAQAAFVWADAFIAEADKPKEDE